MNSRRIKLPFKVRRPVLACGADTKGAFALASGETAVLYEGFGDLGDLENLERYERAIRRATMKTKAKPAVFVCDMHPGYFSSRFAEPHAPFKVQHHEAHIASAIVDNGIRGDVIGVAFDGTGYGSDGNIWGGEFFAGGLGGFKRAAHLEYVAMPGSDAAVREPRRMAESYVYHAAGKSPRPVIKKMIDRKINSPFTSSAGRLFDAVASIVLEKGVSGFEAELPVELEALADRDCDEAYGFTVKPGACATVSFSSAIRAVMADMRKKTAKSVIAAKFHNTVASAISKTAVMIRKRSRIKKAVLSGGVFQNRYLIDRAGELLKKNGFEVFANSKTAANDSGIPIGQIAIAKARVPCA